MIVGAALLLRAPKNNVAGGRTYDAVIGECAQQGRASTVLTFNAGDFTVSAKATRNAGSLKRDESMSVRTAVAGGLGELVNRMHYVADFLRILRQYGPWRLC